MLRMTINTLCRVLVRTSCMRNPHMGIDGTAVRVGLNVFLDQVIERRTMASQALLFFHHLFCRLS